VENLDRATPEKIKKQDENLARLIDGAYNSCLHDSLLYDSSYIWTLPQVLQDKYIPLLREKVEKGKAEKEKKYKEQLQKQKEWDEKNITKQIIPNVDPTSKKYKDLQFQLIHKFSINKDKK
jgi:hypothetical protein